MNPLISILIPVYNAEKYLERCISSALDQTYGNLEIILVDDGSTDSSSDIGRKYMKSHGTLIQYFFTEHLGVSNARQELIIRSSGEYLFFLDADDFIDPDTIRILYDLSCSCSADMVQCKMQKTSSDEIAKNCDDSRGEVRVYPGDKAVELFQCGYEPLRCMLAAKLYKRKVFEGVCFPVGKVHEDEYVMHYLMANSKIVASTDLPLYYYFKNPGSITKKAFSYERYDILDAIRDRICFYRKNGFSFSADMNCLRYCFHCMELYRQTACMNRKDRHLDFLIQEYRSMANYLLTTKIAQDDDLRQTITQWMDKPLEEELPNYWNLAVKYNKEYFESIHNDDKQKKSE